MLLKLALLCSVLVCTVPFARADDASKLAKIHELFYVMQIDQMLTQSMKQTMEYMNSGVLQRMAGVKLPPDKQQEVSALSARVDKVITDTMSWAKLEPEYAKLYVAAYTEQQIDDMLAFYKSPTGQAVVKENPILLKEGSAIAQQRMATVLPKIQQMLRDFIAQETTTIHQATPQP